MTPEEDFVLDSLKELDRERYIACLYLPEEIRRDISALWAFDAEVSQIPLRVSEPMPGEIRLQFWRDAIKTQTGAQTAPLATALNSVLEKHNLPRESLHIYLDAKLFDLYHDPMPDKGSFEGYLGETVSVFYQLAARCAGAEQGRVLADISGHAGMASGIAKILSRNALDRANQRIYVPLDLIEKHNLDRESWINELPGENHVAVIEELCSLLRFHLNYARAVIGKLPKHANAVFLPLACAEALARKVTKAPWNCFERPLKLSPLQQHWVILKTALRGHI